MKVYSVKYLLDGIEREHPTFYAENKSEILEFLRRIGAQPISIAQVKETYPLG